MATEDESWREKFSNTNENGDREGYRPSSSNSGRTQRPRITRPAYSASSNGEQRSYRPRVNRDSDQGSFRPSYQREGGYSSREPREPREGGFRPSYQREGGYQPRESREQGDNEFRPSYQQRGGGYGQQRGGGYGQQRGGGYGQQRGGGYGQQRGGGYGQQRGGGYGQQRGGYGQQRGGYGQQRGGGYGQQRGGGYGQQRGGFGGGRQQQRGGYDPNAKYSAKKRIEYSEAHIDPNQPLRLNKFLANAGVCSRREADDFIQAGVVSVNGNVVTELGTKVMRSDTVMFHDQLVTIEKKVYVLLNKPKDYVTTSDDPQNRKTVMDLVQDACRERIYPVGRLDRNTTGVLLLTNDGDLASKLTHPQFLKKKIYHVHLDKNVTAADMRQIAEGITLDDGEIHADAIEYSSETDKKQVGIEIHSGRNRIVRRIFEHFGYRVVKLDRVFFAGLTKKNLRRGDWRYLTEKEVNMLRMGAFE
ncbi:MAG: rRNA pseudouridine synthase [Bacteroidaceae bacterium]|nr:rRNA pseudouridine synthase [Bacteroidaceae bacterium]